MALSEKLYALRKKSGLSQEQLAEHLGVSRQAISKWETGQSIPENEKILAISNYFNVSLDYLMKDIDSQDNIPQITQNVHPKRIVNCTKWFLGAIFCVIGVVCLIIWGLLSIFSPTVSDQISESSMISINGNGIFLFVCIVTIIVGALLLLKNMKQK
ncbi:MAG: helix-turn-helix transcriptional regulator [Clostridiales bacterium]|nr:helix-turn-helix transcriptional regulator [Clostridiales bacterium]